MPGGKKTPQHAKGVSRLFRTHQNVGFLPKRPYHTAVVDSQGFGFNILVHRLTKANPALATGDQAPADAPEKFW